MKRLPFYDVYDELIKPTTLASTSTHHGFEEAPLSFGPAAPTSPPESSLPETSCPALNVTTQSRSSSGSVCVRPAARKNISPPTSLECEREAVPLRDFSYPPPRTEQSPQRPSRPINISPLIRLSSTVPTTSWLNWSSELAENYSLSVYLVKQLTSVTLLQKLRAKGIRNPDHSRALIKEKLTADPDSEIATTSLRVSLMCPLGKMRLTVPCRATTCTHLQCFDAALYLQMNEKKPTWTCPVCDKKAPYDMLIIDGLFMDILNSCTDCDEIQFMEDGSWCPMKPKKEKQDLLQPTSYGGIDTGTIYNLSSDLKHNTETKKKVEVIDLTLDSSSDEDEPAPKRPCPITSAAIPSVGSKGVISIDHQPSSVLRSPPMATIGSDYLSSLPLPDYRTFPVPSDLQGLDIFSFLQTPDNQHYSPSVITSLDEQDALNHFFQYRAPPTHYMSPLTQAMAGSHGVSNGASRISSIVSTSTLRESHGHSTSQNSTPTLPGCRPDIISLD
ncbi:hypothetical protein GDO81_021213 [Engystomops pustulosus]|uniref:Uncharacterized protein n=1 Tax=Engystomops pustulosus TaxID=76066 RepID=A0AAV6Z6Z4_ENGPU|nr:hypothetical protein GDO81_021213 [Engystomops pustulosus]